MSIATEMTPEERRQVGEVLSGEYGVLMAALGAAWSASLSRTSIFLGVLSAAGIALGFASQGGVGGAEFRGLALVVLPLVLFLGVATFVRLVQVQRESVVYITGMNRIRHFLQETAPASRPYFILPAHDDQVALYRSPGTGMSRRPPRFRLLYLAVQTQGIVGVVTSVVAAGTAGLAATGLGPAIAWGAAGGAFLITLAALFAYWQRSLTELFSAIRPLHPTPPEEMDAWFGAQHSRDGLTGSPQCGHGVGPRVRPQTLTGTTWWAEKDHPQGNAGGLPLRRWAMRSAAKVGLGCCRSISGSRGARRCRGSQYHEGLNPRT